MNLLEQQTLLQEGGFSQKEITLTREVGTAEDFLLLMSKQSGGEWINLFENKKMYKVAINQELSSWKDPIYAGDELAIFPPITGG